ncbi:MAG: hypothetical protein J6L62_02995 [Clostridia bacterium]|nr:hypothetical protein [Clostridia bacterium]
MAKKLLCVVLSVTMLLGVFAIASSANQYYDYTPEEAQAEVAEKGWYLDYDADVDWKDEIDRRWLTGSELYDGTAETAAPQDVLEYNLFFWADEIIEAYNNATSNEDYWNLYNKMATPEILYYTYEEDGEKVTECDILYDYAYEYREEEKAEFELDFVVDKEYAMPGDVVTVEIYATSNFLTSQVRGGFYYDKSVLAPYDADGDDTTVEYIDFNEEADPTWVGSGYQAEQAVQYDDEGNITFDRRKDFWPEAMYTEENLAKYGVMSFYAASDFRNLPIGGYNHGRQFDNELLFTAKFVVKEDAAIGTEATFFVPDGCVASVQDLGAAENGNGEDASIWVLYRVDYVGLTEDTLNLSVDYNAQADQTVVSNDGTVIIGEEPAPAEKGEIVDVVTSDTYIGDTAVVSVDVTGTPDSLRVTTPDGYQIFTRDDADITTTEAGETWTIEIFVAEAEVACTVYADYGDLGVTDGTDFTLIGLVKKDLSIHSIEIPDMYPDAQNGGVITAGKHDVIIKTSTDVVKIQFYAEDGTTYTYTSWSGAGKVPYEDIDGERVWTINHAFGPFGTRSLVIRTRSAETFFAATDSTLDATVVY